MSNMTIETGLCYKKLSSRAGFSLGASGAICAILAVICATFPDSQMQIVFLPWFQFSAQTALIGLMSFDLAGMVFKWRIFDHAAHFGGVLFGLFWCKFGTQWFWEQRYPIMKKWHEVVHNGKSPSDE